MVRTRGQDAPSQNKELLHDELPVQPQYDDGSDSDEAPEEVALEISKKVRCTSIASMMDQQKIASLA